MCIYIYIYIYRYISTYIYIYIYICGGRKEGAKGVYSLGTLALPWKMSRATIFISSCVFIFHMTFFFCCFLFNTCSFCMNLSSPQISAILRKLFGHFTVLALPTKSMGTRQADHPKINKNKLFGHFTRKHNSLRDSRQNFRSGRAEKRKTLRS